SFFTLRKQSGFMHLWFLQHLIVFYVLLIMVLIVSRRLPEVGAGLSRMLSRIRINSLTLIVMTSILLGGISLLFDTALPSIWTGFIIPVPQLLCRLFLFMLCWLIDYSLM